VVPQKLNTHENLREDLDAHLMLFFTGKTRKSETILAEQKENIPDKEEVLCQMAEQARQLRESLEAGDYYSVGRAMKDNWELKKKLASNISNPELDELYDQAMGAGAIGGKISGAGGGGFFLLFVPPGKRQNVRDALADLREMPFHLERDGSKVIFNTGQR
jgi:D-glycero-alpha-D-manno-heptose-7-phosphate kinase